MVRLRHHLDFEIVDAAFARNGCYRASIMVASSKTSTAHDTNT